jgi:hypothetical protein
VQTTPVAAHHAGAQGAPGIVHNVLGSPGQPLESATQAFMEARFGHGFDHVRVHADGPAAKSARAVNALAYTVGPHIVFGAERYAPGTAAGRRLLAHELSHVLQQRGAPRLQRATPEAETSADPAVESATPGPTSSTQTAVTPPKLRIADVRYDAAGQPLEEPLAPADKARLQALVDKLKTDDPAFYAAIENEDVVVTAATLPPDNVGKHLLNVTQSTRTMSKLRWLVVELGGIDLSQGIDMSSDAWKKGVELFQQAYPDSQQQNALATEDETRTTATFSSVLMLDLAQIEAREDAYRTELERTRSTSARTPEAPQSALATLRHEAGHLLFERVIGYDNAGNALPATPLTGSLKSQVEKHSGDEDIATDVELLSEYAAEGVEQMNAPFDMAKFQEENDPRFGVSGYHDVDGNVQAPTGFGVRMARGLTLVAAKAVARKLGAVAPGAVFLLTVPKPAAEQRLFDVLMLMGPDKKTVRDTFDLLYADHPELQKYKSSIAAY